MSSHPARVFMSAAREKRPQGLGWGFRGTGKVLHLPLACEQVYGQHLARESKSGCPSNFV
jgi:hypothetical protein